MNATLLAWIAVGAYAVVLGAFAVRGALRTRSVESFSIGNRDLPPSLVGLSLMAQLTSVATFVINPGLVFHSGVSALMGLGVAAAAGITTGLIVLSSRFRQVGTQVAALTLPSWIGKRYESAGLRLSFSALSLGLIAYAVLIVVALALVLSGLLGVSASTVAIGLTVFVTACVVFGGANAHAWTNALQAIVMLVVAVLLIGAGLPRLLSGELLANLRATDPNLVALANPSSLYFRSLFEVFACNFLVGLALVCQPHIVSKTLYLRDDSQVRRYLTVAVLAGSVFLGVLLVGLYARGVVPAGTRIDLVVPTWLAATFSPGLRVLVALGMLSAGLSTLEGILLALASIASVDLHPWAARVLGGADEPARALRFGRQALVGFAVVTVLLALRQLANPTGGTVAIFAQYGVYALFTAASIPLACGMFLPSVRRTAVSVGVAAAAGTYVVLGLTTPFAYANNPAVLATAGLAAGWASLGLVAVVSARVARRAPQTATA